MNHHIGQTSSNLHSHSDNLQIAVLTQQNKLLTRDVLPFEVEPYQNQDELNILLNIAKQVKYHYCAVEQNLLLCLPEKASQVSRTVFLSYLLERYGDQLTKGTILFLCDPLTNTYISLIYDTLSNPLSDTLFEFLKGVWSEMQHLDRAGVFKKSSFEFLQRLASTLNTAALQSWKESVHKIARQEKEGFTHLLKTYISSVKDADLNEEKILDSLTLRSCYIHRLWNSPVRRIFPATKLIAETYTQLIPKLQETLHYIYDPNWFSQHFITITEEVPSETIQKLSINHNNIEKTL